MAMKKIAAVLLCLFIAVPSALAFSACGGQEIPPPPEQSGGSLGWDDIYDPDRPDTDFDYDYDYVKPEPPELVHEYVPDPDPAYEAGTATVVTRMEGENAEVDFHGTNNSAWRNVFSDVDKLAFDFRLSNKLCTRNLNDSWQGGTRLIFTFDSDKSYSVRVTALISTHDDKTDPYVPASNFRVRSEGTDASGDGIYSYADLSGIELPRAESVELVSGGDVDSQYFHFAELEFDAAIYEGETSIIFEYSGGGKGCNVDYIEIDTSANISGWDDTFYMDGDTAESEDGTTSEWVVTQAPTDDDAGTFTAIKYIADGYHEYNYGLPALKDEEGNLTEGYTAEADGKYSFEFKRGKVTFVPGQTPEVTATLGENSLAGFAGDVQSLSRHMGDILSADDFAVPADKPDRVIGTVRVYDTAGHYVGTAEPGVWTFPAYDVVLEVASLTRVGYTQYDCGNEQSNRLPQPVYGGAIKANFTYSAAFGTLIHGSEAGDEMYGSVLSYAGTLTPRGAPLPTEDEPEPAEADTQFRMATHIGATDSDKPVVLGKTHSFVYNFENFGESRIYLRLNQVNASNTVEDGDAGVVINLDPGESVTVQIDIEFANGSANRNVMALFTVLDDITDMKLGIAFAAKIAK